MPIKPKSSVAEISKSDQVVLQLYADNIQLQLECDDLRYKVSFLQAQVEALEEALATVDAS